MKSIHKIHVIQMIIYTMIISVLSTEEVMSVYRIIPKSEDHLRALRSLTFGLESISFWKNPTSINASVDLMVSNDDYETFQSIMKEKNLIYKLTIPDVQELLHNASAVASDIQIRRKIRKNLGWTQYHTLNDIYSWLDNLSRYYRNNVRLIEAGKSYEGRLIKGLHLRFGQKKPGIFIEAGIHAREWISPATATHLINELLTSSDPGIRWLANSFDWYIFPCVNPDGYEFTYINPQNLSYRLWRKTRSPTRQEKCWRPGLCYEQICYGADPNRNWNYGWGGPGSSRYACSELFSGSKPFSEIEMLNLAGFIDSIAGDLFAYISFHSYGQKLLIPYGNSAAHLDNYDQEFEVGKSAINALSRRYGTRYNLGNIFEMIKGPASGSSIDWVKANYKLPFVYCYELRGQTSNGEFYGFLTPPSEIIPNGQEIMDSLVALFRAATLK